MRGRRGEKFTGYWSLGPHNDRTTVNEYPITSLPGMEQTRPTQCLNGRAEVESDASLIARFRKGEEEAFDELVRKHQQRVFNIAYQVLRNFEDANEVGQDAFVKVYQHLADFRGESAFTTWLFQIVTNLARNRVRYNQRR